MSGITLFVVIGLSVGMTLLVSFFLSRTDVYKRQKLSIGKLDQSDIMESYFSNVLQNLKSCVNQNDSLSFERAAGPVSYTHLDVYKRQSWHCSFICSCGGTLHQRLLYRLIQTHPKKRYSPYPSGLLWQSLFSWVFCQTFIGTKKRERM